MAMIEVHLEVPDAIQVLEATEQRLARLIEQRDRNGIESVEERLVIGQLQRAVVVQRIALFGDADAGPIVHRLDCDAEYRRDGCVCTDRAALRERARHDVEEDQRAVAV